MKALPKLRSLGVVLLICLGAAAIIWLTVSKNLLARPGKQSDGQKSDGELAAIVGGNPVTVSEVENKIKAQLSRMRADQYNLKRKALNEIVGQLLIEEEAKKRGMSVADLTSFEIEGKAAPVTAEDKKAEYEKFKARFADKSEADLTKLVDESLHRRRISERGLQFVSELKSRANVKMLLEPPRFDVDTNGDPSLGPENAPVTIIEFSEFQCPYCAQVQPTLKKLKERYGDRIRVVFRNFPLPMHKDAPKAAEAAACANEQGKFWEMHDKLFANAPKLQILDLKRYATEIGLQTDRFDHCLDAGKYTAKWQGDKVEGSSYGVSGTPAFFINGRMVGGAVPYEDFAEMIEEELQRAATAPKSR